MSKPKKKQKTEAPEASVEAMQRRRVLVTEADAQNIRAAFAEGKPATVTVHPPQPKAPLTPEQRERRKAYQARPEVKERMKAYRAARAKEVRELVRAAKATAAQQEQP